MRAWLVEQGFEPGDLRSEKEIGNCMMTPMAQACFKGELNVCKWLYHHGAAEDISRADNGGNTPMLLACENGHLSVCEWLVLNGALNRPTSSTAAAAAAEEEEDEYDQAGHVDQAIVKRDTRDGSQHHLTLLAWAQRLLATHHTFFHVFLRGSVVMPRHRTSPRRRCHLPLLPGDELERVGSFLGVETGRRVRNVREFAEAMAALLVEGNEET